MKTKYLPDYPRIAAADLARLTLDPVSARQFTRRFQIVELSVACLVCTSFLVGYILYARGTISAEACVGGMCSLGVPALVVLFAIQRRELHARPFCLRSGRKMEPYVVQEREQEDLLEIAYIDRSSDSYFTKLYAF